MAGVHFERDGNHPPAALSQRALEEHMARIAQEKAPLLVHQRPDAVEFGGELCLRLGEIHFFNGQGQGPQSRQAGTQGFRYFQQDAGDLDLFVLAEPHEVVVLIYQGQGLYITGLPA